MHGFYGTGHARRRYTMQGTPNCVLVVDDDRDVRSLVRDALALRGFRVETADDGLQALMKVRASRPDAVVLDLSMPVMDGWTFLELYRRDNPGGGPPVVVVSEHPELRDIATALRVEGFLSKPFDVRELADTIERLLEIRHDHDK